METESRILTLCMLGNFSCFFSCLIFFQNQLSRKILSGIPSNSLDPDQNQQNVGLDQGPSCLQRLSADDTSRKELKSTKKQIQPLQAIFNVELVKIFIKEPSVLVQPRKTRPNIIEKLLTGK